jgi:hypothetical protein
MKIAEISIVYIYEWLDLLGNGGEKNFIFLKKGLEILKWGYYIKIVSTQY